MILIYQRIQRFIPDEKKSSQIELIAKALLILYVFCIFLGSLLDMYHIPINKPYFTGSYDEPFSINAGINVLHNNGDPVFYNYGGITSYTSAMAFYLYCTDVGVVPYYKGMDKKFAGPHFPVLRKIYPVKPVYIAKVAIFVLFLLLSFLYVASFTWLLLPVSFLLINSITSSTMATYMSQLLLPDNHLFLLSGLTVLFFIKALLEEKTPRYFSWVAICTILASLTIAVKLNSAYIILLPLSLLPRLFKEKYLNWKYGGILFGCIALPYLIINPSVLFSFSRYKSWLIEMQGLSGTSAGSWFERVPEISYFIKDLSFLRIFPVVVVIILFITASILMIKRNPFAFAAFIFFLLYSLNVLTNMKHDFYPRHLMFLMLPLQLLVFFPLIYLFQKSPKQIRAVFTIICLVVTLNAFPPPRTFHKIGRLGEKSFTTKWKQESRDHLADFVKTNNARLYFLDYHNFSLPNNIHDRILPFTDKRELPQNLEADEFVALVLYKTSKNKIYNQMRDYLLTTYETVNSFGNPKGTHDISFYGPQINPTILLLKEKKQNNENL